MSFREIRSQLERGPRIHFGPLEGDIGVEIAVLEDQAVRVREP